MSSDGDLRVKYLPNGDEENPIETAGDLYAPDTSEGGTGDISEPAKKTLRQYLRNVTLGHGPQHRGVATANSEPVPEEGTITVTQSVIRSQGQTTRTSAEAGRDTWVVGHPGGDIPTRDPFGPIISALKGAMYPLGQYVPAGGLHDTEKRPGTIASSLQISPTHRERAAEIGADPGHKTARTEAATIATEEYHRLHDAVSHALSYNRFSPTSDSPFVVGGKKTGLGWALQRTLGAYNPDAASPTDKQLREVGARLSYLQTGHKDGGNWATVMPTLTQMGLGSEIDLHDLQQVDALITETARSQVYTILDDRINDGIGNQTSYDSPLGTPLSIKGDKTYGVLNSFHEPFQGTLGIFLIVAIQLVALIVVGLFLELLFGDFLDPGKRTDDAQGLKGRELSLGRNRPMRHDANAAETSLDFVKHIFGYPDHLQHKFGDAFMEGLVGFYGVDPDDLLSDPAGTFLNLWESSGFYAIVIRLVSQDMFDYPEIANAFDGKTDQVSALMKTFTILKTSHTVKFVMTMTRLGDQILIYQDGVAKNRIREQSGNGAWGGAAMGQFMGAGSSGAMMLGSLRLKNLSNRFGNVAFGNALAPSAMQLAADTESLFLEEHIQGTAGIYRHGGSGASVGDPTFIDTQTRKMYENALDATYCPFYFHDLRTNEIISFHAFLTNLNDSFQVNYEDISGHGRIEPSKIYQSTVRSISVSFKVCAVTAEDVDAMYLKLNRLLAMCYPQYTAGRAIGEPGKILRAPYSQMPSSTPLVRLRVGDIITANASQLGLARLHGAVDGEDGGHENEMSPNANYPGLMTDSGNPGPQGSSNIILRGHERLYFAGTDEAHPSGFTVQDALNMLAHEGNNHPPPLVCSVAGNKNTSNGMITYVIEGVTDANGVPINEDVFDMLAGEGYSATDKFLEEGWRETYDKPKTKPAGTVQGFFALSDAPKELSVPVADVETGPSNDLTNGGTYNITQTGPKGKNKLGFGEDISMDLTDTSLSVVRSFHESGGRGLPGVITSIDFGNFAEETTVWGIDRGYRAPRMADVTISFSVVHDLPPGLDSAGQMNSAIYGVGISKAYNKGDF